MRILFLEDNAFIRTTVGSILARRGWNVLTYPEPAACPLYKSTKCTCQAPNACVDVIVTDFDLPDMDGCSFVEQLREKGCRVKNVALYSDTKDSTSITRAREIGFAHFSKSQDVAALLEWLQEVESQLQPLQASRPEEPATTDDRPSPELS